MSTDTLSAERMARLLNHAIEVMRVWSRSLMILWSVSGKVCSHDGVCFSFRRPNPLIEGFEGLCHSRMFLHLTLHLLPTSTAQAV